MTYFILNSTERELLERLRSDNRQAVVFRNVTIILQSAEGRSKAELSQALGCSISTIDRARGDDNHFIPNYRSGKAWCPPATAMIEEMFSFSDKYLRQRGGWIKNATRGGQLEVLERTSFDEELALLSRKTQ